MHVSVRGRERGGGGGNQHDTQVAHCGHQQKRRHKTQLARSRPRESAAAAAALQASNNTPRLLNTRATHGYSVYECVSEEQCRLRKANLEQ